MSKRVLIRLTGVPLRTPWLGSPLIAHHRKNNAPWQLLNFTGHLGYAGEKAVTARKNMMINIGRAKCSHRVLTAGVVKSIIIYTSSGGNIEQHCEVKQAEFAYLLIALRVCRAYKPSWSEAVVQRGGDSLGTVDK